MSQELEGTLTNTANLVGTFGSEGGGGTTNYNDLINKPSINSVTLQGNKTSSQLGFANVATSGSYDDLTNKPTIPAAQVNSDWNATSGVAEILNKPSIPAAQVNSDWNASSGVAEILNKPTLATVATTGAYSDLSGTPTLATVATSGNYDDLTNKPTIPQYATDLPISSSDLTTDTKTYIDNIADYSTSEKAVGKWIDGSTIYQKTVDLGALPNTTSANTPHNIRNLKFVIGFEGASYMPNAVFIPLPFVSDSSIYVAVSSVNVTITTTSDRSGMFGYVTLRYIKN